MDVISNLRRMAVFAAVVRAGSFTAAADELGLSKGVVSAHVSRLEEELGTQLLQRTTRRQRLTEAGRSYYESCRRILAEAEEATRRITEQRDQPTGTLRLTTSSVFGVQFVVAVLHRFTEAYPAVGVDLVLEDRQLDLLEHDLDLALRVGALQDTAYVRKRLGAMGQWLCAAPAYLERHGTPTQPGHLAHHRWVALTVLSPDREWTFRDARGVPHPVTSRARIVTSDVLALRAFALAGTGIAVLPDFAVRDAVAAGELEHLLTGYELPTAGVYALYPSRRAPARVRHFVDYLARELA